MLKLKEKPKTAKNVFSELYYEFSESNSSKVLLSHHGKFTDELVNGITETLERMLTIKDCSSTTIRRMFSIVLEGLQNICLCSKKDGNGDQFGHLMIKELDGKFCVSIGNIIDTNSKPTIQQHIDKLNGMEYPQLKEFYSRNIFNGYSLVDRCTKLGFNTIALKSKSQINYQFHNFENNGSCYFEMSVVFD